MFRVAHDPVPPEHINLETFDMIDSLVVFNYVWQDPDSPGLFFIQIK